MPGIFAAVLTRENQVSPLAQSMTTSLARLSDHCGLKHTNPLILFKLVYNFCNRIYQGNPERGQPRQRRTHGGALDIRERTTFNQRLEFSAAQISLTIVVSCDRQVFFCLNNAQRRLSGIIRTQQDNRGFDYSLAIDVAPFQVVTCRV
jgi:hypothetical protein